LATLSIACNYATRSLIPIAAHAIQPEAAEQLVSESTSAFFAGDLVAQLSAGLLVRHVAGPWLLALSTLGWTSATLLAPAALRSSAPRLAHSALQLARGVLCGIGYPSAHALVATTPVEVRSTALGLINSSAGIGTMAASALVPPLLRDPSAWARPFGVIGLFGLAVAGSLAWLCVHRRLGLATATAVTTRGVDASDAPPRHAGGGGGDIYARCQRRHRENGRAPRYRWLRRRAASGEGGGAG
jgi:MFS family permease